MKIFKNISVIILALGIFIQNVNAQNISGVINDYVKVALVGTNDIQTDPAYPPSAFSGGDRVMLIQMKGAMIDTTNTSNFGSVSSYGNAGNYEVLTVDFVDGTLVKFECEITRAYDPNFAVQLIRIPIYPNPTVDAILTALPWDGNIGGVLALETPGTLTLDKDIDISSLGFRGGVQDNNPNGSCGTGVNDYFYGLSSGLGAEKGEGIAIPNAGFVVGKGALANGGGGGNKHNSGGAGGGNYTAGGQGGMQTDFCPSVNNGGVGGYSLPYNISLNKVFLGGGGGAGDHNDGAGAYQGGAGGGIVFINANMIEGKNNFIKSNGAAVPLIPNSSGDGAGGGGAGGTILLDVNNYGGTNLQLEANGGDGGSQNVTFPACFGPGGGGGIGMIWTTGGGLPSNVSFSTIFGNPGIDQNSSSMCFSQSFGAQPGGPGEGLLTEFMPVYTECSMPCEPVPDTCCNAAVDVLFIMDNSGSVSNTAFNTMVSLSQQAMMDIDSAYCDALFAVAHYAGICGDEIYIEHDFTTAGAAQNINRANAAFSALGDDLNGALGTIRNAIDGTADPLIVATSPFSSLSDRPSATLLLVIFTDAAAFDNPVDNCINGASAMRPYTNSNILKASPYDASVTLVHFRSTLPGVQSVGAAISSAGGNYSGTVDLTNTGDPTINTVPRQFIPASFSTTSLNLLGSTPPCDSLIEFICCDDLLVNSTKDQNPNACCYDVDITNNAGPTVTCFEAEILSTDWQYDNGNLTIGSGFSWSTTPTNNILSIEHSSGNIPAGTSPNVLNYCLIPKSTSPSSLQTIVYRWYQILPDSSKRIVCTDTLITECEPTFPDPCLTMNDGVITCNPDNPYEYFYNFTVTNNSSFDVDKIVLEDLNLGYAFSACFTSSPTNIIAIPTDPNVLPSGATSNNMCVKIISPNPIWAPTDVCFSTGLFGEFDCCHAVDSVCVTLENCCDPCDERDIVVNEFASDSASCCYSLDIVDSCGYAYFTKIETEIITPGVIFGYHGLGGPEAANWFVLPNSGQTSITWWNNQSFIPYGTTPDIIQFCLSNIANSSQIPQKVVVKWYAQTSGMGDEFVACTDTLEFDCEVNVPYDCLEISDREIFCVEDSSKYRYNFVVTNTSSIPFSADYLDVTIIDPVGVYFDPSGGIFPLPQSFNPGDSHQVSACIKSTTTFPVVPQDLVLRYRLRYAQGDTCCYEAMQDTLYIPPCGPADCDSLMVMVDQSSTDSCCHTLDFKNHFNGDIKTIELEVLTAGIIFGNHSTTGPDAANWHNPLSTSTTIQWELTSGNNLPLGNYDDLVNFCLDGIDPGEAPQEVVVRWLDPNAMVLCTDTLLFDCLGDYQCVDMTETQLSCENNGDYNFTFTVVNNSNPPHSADLLKFRPIPVTNPIQFSNGTFPLSPVLNFGDSFSSSTTITGAVPGDTLKFEMRLENTSSGDSWCCFESDTFCLVIPSCCDLNTIVVNNGLTPNGDGYNDEFKIIGIGGCSEVSISIYNRWGNIVYEQDDYELGPNWDGKSSSNIDLPQGTYYYIIDFKEIGDQKAGYLDIRY